MTTIASVRRSPAPSTADQMSIMTSTIRQTRRTVDRRDARAQPRGGTWPQAPHQRPEAERQELRHEHLARDVLQADARVPGVQNVQGGNPQRHGDYRQERDEDLQRRREAAVTACAERAPQRHRCAGRHGHQEDAHLCRARQFEDVDHTHRDQRHDDQYGKKTADHEPRVAPYPAELACDNAEPEVEHHGEDRSRRCDRQDLFGNGSADRHGNHLRPGSRPRPGLLVLVMRGIRAAGAGGCARCAPQ